MASLLPKSSDSTVPTLHVTALDALVNVNSIFTGVVFIGLAFSSNANTISLVSTGEDDPCNPSSDTARRVVVFEVLAFASYLLSSLIAQGLKLQMALVGAKKVVPKALVPINEKFIRFGMVTTAIFTVIGTVFLTLSIIFLVELRLGALSCPTSSWSKYAAIPLATSMSIGVFVFMSTAVYAFFV
ncbi:hypothetical protein KP509_16G063300 [Ceratopteris richardii]|uniref:Uncharacterized protein n=1 Tax=Ceratopteris richardii TaxID=49495 RepID=A0A8T2T1D3_CERRI|nr:hypothetical protein KP509_16G063300 [Ceratopteris richardii]KAH7388199.1 hypothetical protein KP509_16G063300 [Ceratopteris richardii]